MKPQPPESSKNATNHSQVLWGWGQDCWPCTFHMVNQSIGSSHFHPRSLTRNPKIMIFKNDFVACRKQLWGCSYSETQWPSVAQAGLWFTWSLQISPWMRLALQSLQRSPQQPRRAGGSYGYHGQDWWWLDFRISKKDLKHCQTQGFKGSMSDCQTSIKESRAYIKKVEDKDLRNSQNKVLSRVQFPTINTQDISGGLLPSTPPFSRRSPLGSALALIAKQPDSREDHGHWTSAIGHGCCLILKGSAGNVCIGKCKKGHC